MNTTYQIEGMHCASCATKIEKALGGVSGVTKVSVNFATETARVEGNATIEELNAAVRRVGPYRLLPADEA
jgi:Cu+-exporting ATPase